ncbi:hypothetical protein LCGC14_1301440 [marine sediment metagenome]|uniref:Uncharacterized protein n=1 Tax=marine sediment metagenome TaxID=412755 RepID=A0A0F9LA49_9ZZZZ
MIEKHIITCNICGKQEFAEGNCPNEIMQSTGFIQSDDDYSSWFCSEKCREEETK